MAIAFGWLAILQHSVLLELAAETTSSPTLGLTRSSESFLQEFALFLKIVLEFIAILIIAVSLVVALQKLIRKKQKRFQSTQQAIRLELGISLALSLEFLLAADIVSTAVSPSWDAIASQLGCHYRYSYVSQFFPTERSEGATGDGSTTTATDA
jgi:uncharacterized membrane protein